MGISSFRKGAAINIRGKRATLLRRIAGDTWQVEDAESQRITEMTRADLNRLYASAELTFVNSLPPRAARNGNETPPTNKIATDADWEEAKLRRLYVKAVLDVPNSKVRFEEAIANVWGDAKKPERAPGWTTVYRWKSRYLAAGKDITSLLPQKSRRGNKRDRYSPEVMNEVKDAVELVYMDLGRPTIQDTLDRAQAMVIRENRLRPTSMQLELPTRRLVTRVIGEIPSFDRYAARHGRQQAARRFRSVQAHRTTEAPLERAEIDHTPLDLIVLDDGTSLPLGRPYVTACIDDYTRCLLGLFISFEPPSYFTVARCLRHAFVPKADLQATYPEIANSWDAHGVMRELVVDNGPEFHSESLENACYSLGIEIHYSARKTPWFKGKIERFLGTLNRETAHGVAGTTFSNILEKEDYDPSKFAIVRYSVLKEVVCRWVADVYHQRPHRTTGAPPAVMWNSSIHPDDILLPDDPAQLDLVLGQSMVRTLTHKGIELFGLLYNSSELTQLRYRIGDATKVEIRVDAADLGTIFVIDPDRTTSYKVPALQRTYASGLSLWQHRVCKKFAATQLDKYDSAGWLEAKERIRELIDNEFLHRKMRTRKKIGRYQQSNIASAPRTASGAPIPAGAVPLLAESKSPRSLAASKLSAPVDSVPSTQPSQREDTRPTNTKITETDPTQPESGTTSRRSPTPKKYKPIVRQRSPAATLEEDEDQEGAQL
jgi:putative transposase